MSDPQHRPITVVGDCMLSAYRLPAHTLSEKDRKELAGDSTSGFWATMDPHREYGFHAQGGANILLHAVRTIQGDTAGATLVRQCSPSPFVSPSMPDTVSVLTRVEEKQRDGSKRVVIRIDEDGEIPIGSDTFVVSAEEALPAITLQDTAVLAHWLLPLHHLERYRRRKDFPIEECELPSAGPRCSIHVQVGLLVGDGKRNAVEDSNPNSTSHCFPNQLARPADARIIVTCLDEICPHVRVRRALSYDSIVVDLLSVIRGCDSSRNPLSPFPQMIGCSKGAIAEVPCTLLVVRINNAAALLYQWEPGSVKPESAWLLFHKERSAPIIDPGKGKMLGYNTRIGAAIAVAASRWAQGQVRHEELLAAVDRAMQVQFMHYTEGFGKLMAKADNDGCISGKEIGLAARQAWNDAKIGNDSPIHRVEIDIADAVARHSQWFITKNWKPEGFPKDDKPEKRFRKVAEEWLCSKEGKKPTDSIPTVSIKKQLLVDRREIEDYLSLRGEMIRYAGNTKAGTTKRPLNLAVFGPPGSGKSFGIKQVTADILEFGGYDDPPLEFNLSQFTSLDDYAVAFHQVRDSCLKPKVPIVFFDEFDSNFEGVPFGWLKYFLAPMQDGEFTERGRKYRLGPCVIVFAGGVNRSFEEFAGRSRNPAFIEAKGPDFMSRLRDHINIRGINKPDDDDHFDQGRYLLRRGAFLHGMLCERLRRHKDEHEAPLVHPAVARAFLGIDRFRHGIRSMEAILDMSNLRLGVTLGPSDLPPLEQLNMHVGGREFLDLVLKS